MTTRSDTEARLREARTAMYGLISERVVSGAPGDWMRFEEAVNAEFDRLLATPPDTDPAIRSEDWDQVADISDLRNVGDADTDPSPPTTKSDSISRGLVVGDTDPSGLGDVEAANAAWDDLLGDDLLQSKPLTAIIRHRPIIEAAIRAPLEVQLRVADGAYEAGKLDAEGEYRAAIQESRAGGGLDVERLAEAWANVMDGRRMGSGLNAERIGRGTTTADDWQAIAAEYAGPSPGS